MSKSNYTTANVVIIGSSKTIKRISNLVRGANGKKYVEVLDENVENPTRCDIISSNTESIYNNDSRLRMTVSTDKLSLMKMFLNEMTETFVNCKFYIEFITDDKSVSYCPSSHKPMHPTSEIVSIDCKSNSVFKFSESNAYKHYLLAVDVVRENIDPNKKKSKKPHNDKRKSSGELMISKLIYKLNYAYVNSFYDDIHSMSVIENPDTTLDDALNSVLSA